MEKITFITDDGEAAEFYVEEQTTIGGNTYLLVTDSMDDEASAYILKDVSEEGSSDACYEMVEDDAELTAVARVFRETMDDVDIV